MQICMLGSLTHTCNLKPCSHHIASLIEPICLRPLFSSVQFTILNIITALWPVLSFDPADGRRRLDWPEWPGTHRHGKTAFHDTDTDILARIVARMSVSVSWNAGLNPRTVTNLSTNRARFRYAHRPYHHVRPLAQGVPKNPGLF